MAAWFKPKRYGYGATPVTWQGWAIVAAFLAAVAALAWGLLGFGQPEPPNGLHVLFFVKAVILLVIAVWIISKRNTDGEWRWRWGEDSKQGAAE